MTSEHSVSTRRQLLAMIQCGAVGALLPFEFMRSLGHTDSRRTRLYVAPHDFIPIAYEETPLEIVGASSEDLSILPGFEDALVREVLRVTGLNIARSEFRNINKVNCCGLFTVYTCEAGLWRKYRLWNYHADALPDYPVEHAG